MKHLDPNVDHMDDDRPPDAPAQLYAFDLVIDGQRYGGQMPAKSAKEALELTMKIGGVLMGRVVETQCEGICAICKGDIVHDEEHLKPEPDDDKFFEEHEDIGD